MDTPKNESTPNSQLSKEKNIAGGLNSLKIAGQAKSEAPFKGETLASRMPSRAGNSEKDIHKGIKIPTSSDLHEKTLVSQGVGDNKTKLQIPHKGAPTQPAKKDDSIFGGKTEISRVQLRQKLRYDPKIWEAQRDLRMNLSPMERVKLEKETFASVYGRNISKRDLDLNVKRLSREWSSTTDMKKKETLRKEIKFFKKIGGI